MGGLRRIALAAALLLIGGLAHAQMYSWRDSATGATKFSNVAPYWCRTGAAVGGPRVIVTIGSRVIDAMACPYEDRLRLSGKSKDQIERPQQQRLPDVTRAGKFHS